MATNAINISNYEINTVMRGDPELWNNYATLGLITYGARAILLRVAVWAATVCNIGDGFFN